MAESAQQYLALVISDEWVTAAIWQLVNSKASILNHSQVISFQKDESGDLNQAIDTALDNLGDAGLTLKNVLYVLPHHWVKENDLIEDRKRFLKSLSQDLVLEPLGFVVLTDTILAHENTKHGVNFSGLIMSDTVSFWDVVICENGEEKKVERIGKSGNLEQDLQELEARLKDMSQPQRVLLLTSPENNVTAMENHLQKLFSVSIETLLPEQIFETAIQTGGKEVLAGENSESLAPEQKEASEQIKDEDSPLLNAPPVGFAPPAFAQTSSELNPESNLETPRHQFTEPTNFAHLEEEIQEPQTAVNEQTYDQEKAPTKNPLNALKNISFSLPPALFGFMPFMKKTPLAWIGGGVLVVILILLIGGYFVLAQTYKAHIDVWLATQQLEIEDTFLIGDITESASESGLIATTFTEQVTLDKEVPTTGSKIIGDPAKGRVKIYNKTSQSKLFSAGTLISANGVSFTLDEDVTIASASSEGNGPESVTIKSGVSEVAVTAVNIGPEGNLGKDTLFTVANFDSSSYEAENESAFSGGTQREIQAVSQKDVDQAASDLIEAGKTQLTKKIESNQKVDEYVFSTDEFETTDITPSSKIGSEAKFVRVSVTITGTALRITAEELQETAQQLLGDKVNEGQMLLSESVLLEPQSISPSGENYQLRAKITGQGVPQLQASAIVSEIQGTYIERARQILEEDNRIQKSEITRQPNWIGWIFTRLPNNPDRISINIRIDHSQ